MAVSKATCSTQCNFFVRERTTKLVQVKPDVKSKAVYCRPEVSHCSSQCDQAAKVDSCTQCVTTVCTTKRETANVGSQHSVSDVLAIAIEKVLYVLRTMSVYDCLQYEVC